MIGQTKVLETLKNMQELPHSMLIIGRRRSGRKTLIKEVFDNDKLYWAPDVSIQSVRDVVQASYKYSNMVFVLADIDNASVNAKNAVLKVIEECPNNNYYVLTAMEETAVLPTILSRSYIVRMMPYTKLELMDYRRLQKSYEEVTDLLYNKGVSFDWCQTPGDVDLILDKSFYDPIYKYAVFVVDHIAYVSGANALKIPQKLKLTEKDGDKFDLRVFLSVAGDYFYHKGFDVFKLEDKKQLLAMLNCCVYTNKVLAILEKKSVNKTMLIDDWIFTIRRYLMEVEDD